MKDHRFIELLNLYIDRQITVAETAELEAEIQQNPDRQAVYRQYCRIHSATKLVYDSFRANAAGQPSLPSAGQGEIELFESKRGKNKFAYFAGGLAAAACLTLVFMRYNASPAADGLGPIAQTEIRPAEPAVVPVAVVKLPVHTTAPEVGLVSLRNTTIHTPDYSAMLAALREQDEERAFAGGHPQFNRTQSLFDDAVFNPNRPAPVQDPRVFRSRTAPAQQAEFSAFQFQR